jgi:phage terminase large subunit-like protein
MDLRRLQADPSEFRRSLLIDADGLPRKLGDCLDPWQRDDFAALDAGWKRAAGQAVDSGVSRSYLERPRGASKTTDLAIMSTWILFASRRTVRGVAAAADQDQSKLLRDAIAGLVRLNPWLKEILDVQAYVVVNRHTQSRLEIITSDAGSSYGLLLDFAIIDELTHWRDDGLWVSLFSAIAKRRDAMLVIISNAGTGQGESWQWKLREQARTSSDWHFSRLERPASWISEQRLTEQRRLLPDLAYRRLWLNQWTTGSGDALSPEDIGRAITLPGPTAEAQEGWAYVAGLDWP